MEERTFTFHISPFDVKKLLPQLSKALEARSALLSRERYPELWSMTDKLNAQNEARNYKPTISRAKSIVFIIVGIILIVPGLVNTQQMIVPLLFGLIGLFVGVRGLTDSGKTMMKRMKKRFNLSAKQLLIGKDRLNEKDCIDITFTEEGISYPANEGEQESIAYDMFESLVETDDLYLFVFDTNVTVLQKADLLGGDFTAFNALLNEKITHIVTKDDFE